MSNTDNPSRGRYLAAVRDFRSARRHAILEKIAFPLSEPLSKYVPLL